MADEINAPGLSRRDLALLPASGLALAAIAAAAPAQASTAVSRKLSADDRLDLIDLHARYCWAYDCADVESYLATFAPDGELVPFGGEPVRGHDALRKLVVSMFEHERGDEAWQHHNTHFQFRVQDDQSVAVYCYWFIVQGANAESGYRVRSTGYYVTTCRKQGDEWLISRRELHRWNSNQLPWS